jgi:hypothetical protein
MNVEDRIQELGEDPITAWQNANAEGMADTPAPLPLGSPAPDLGEEPALAVPAHDPDAALHRAAARRHAGAAPARGKAPELAPIVDTGTLADTQEQTRLPDLAPVRPTSAPLDKTATFSELFSAHSSISQRDNSNFDEKMLEHGYAPIVSALGLDASENPAAFSESGDAAYTAGMAMLGQPSRLATAAHAGRQAPFGGNFLVDREGQERLIVDAIKAKRAANPKFLPGVPDTVEGLRAYFLNQQKQGQATDQAVVARSPGGLTGFAAALSGGVVGSFHDPLNVAALAIPGGEGKTLLQIAARDALINGVLELGQQPIVAHNHRELGEDYTVGDAIENVGMAAAGGAAFGSALHVTGKVAMATGVPQAIGRATGQASSAVADKIFAAMPERLQHQWGAAIVDTWARRLDKGEKLDDVFSELSNRELSALSQAVTDGRLTPDERAAAHVLERAEEVGESSPYQPGPAGDATHDNALAAAIKDLTDRRTPETEGLPSGPSAEGTGAASPAAEPARPPAALSTARRPHTDAAPRKFFIAEQGGDQAIASFKAKVGGAENNTGNIHAKNPNSSASGPAQFTDPTFRDYYRKVYGQDPGAHPSRELKDDPAVQSRLLDRLTHDNAAALSGHGEPITEGNLYLAHFLGAADAVRVLKADGSTPIERLLSEDVLRRNDFLRGKSSSEVAAWANKKMGRQVASVSARGDAGALDAATEDPMIAQLHDEALQLDNQIIGAPAAARGEIPPMYARSFNVDDITVDAKRFQFKGGADDHGVTDRLAGVKEWNPIYAGRTIVWEDAEGRAFLADGHQRHGLARRIQAETGKPVSMDALVLREADGVSAEDARTYAALKNIAEGTGTSVDAAKVIRDAGPHVLEHLPPKSALVRDGGALARLSDAAFGAVYNDVVPADFAAVIGHLLPDRPEAHEAMIALLAKLEPATRGQAESIVRQGISAGLHKEEQVDLFGEHEVVTSLMLERAKVLEKVLANLRKSKLVFTTAAKESDTLEAVGSKIAKSASEKEAQANAQALEIVARLAFSHGPVADALNDAAAKLAAGAKLADVADAAARAIRETDLGTLAREAASNDADRLAPDGAGRGGDAGEEGPELPSQSGDPEQPSLIELEHATERFSDPDGKAAQQQAESLVHDLKATYNRADFTDEHADTLPNARKDWKGGPDAEVETAQGPDGRFHYRVSYSKSDGGFASPFSRDVAYPTREAARAAGFRYLAAKARSADDRTGKWIAEHAKLARRDQIKAATAELEKAKPGELASIEPFPQEEPGYHRFRYVAEDGTAVGGNYTLEGDTIDGFNVGDVNNRAELGPAEVRKLFAAVHEQHPEVEYVHAYRKSGSRAAAGAGEQEVWFQFTNDGVKYHGAEDPRGIAPQDAGNGPPAGESPAGGSEQPIAGNAAESLDNGPKVDAAIAETNRQLAELGATAPLRAPSDVDQLGEIGLPLMDAHDQPEFRLELEGETVTAADLLKELDDDAAAIKAIKDCL